MVMNRTTKISLAFILGLWLTLGCNLYLSAQEDTVEEFTLEEITVITTFVLKAS